MEPFTVYDEISIHAPRKGGDDDRGGDTVAAPEHFNPRPPQGGRPAHGVICGTIGEFQSTPPARGATLQWIYFILYFSRISIHAPRKGGDGAFKIFAPLHDRFQSTPPARGATAKMHSFTCGSLTNK